MTSLFYNRWRERLLAPACASLCAGGYGLALARYFFELAPQRFLFFTRWPAAFGLTLLSAILGAALSVFLRARRVGSLPPPDSSTRTPPPFHFSILHLKFEFWDLEFWIFLPFLLPLISLLAPDVNLLRSTTLLLAAPILFLAFLLSSNLQPSSSVVHRPSFLGFGFWDLGLFLLLLYLYLKTLAPSVGEADTFEFQVGIARLGIAHGSGYPLLMLVGKLFTLLPVGGTLAFRANLTSAFFGALAGVGVSRLARQLGCSPVTALLAGFAFGVSPTLWSRAVEVEAYTLNAALVTGILYLCLQIPKLTTANSQLPTPNLPLPTPHLYLLAFLFGLSLTNHLTTILLIPACLVSTSFALRNASLPMTTPPLPRSPAPRPLLKFGVLSFGFFLLGLSVYLYLPLRWPAVNHGELMSWAQFTNILTGNEAKGAFNALLPFTDFSRYAIVARKILSEYGWPGVLLALLGFLSLIIHLPSTQSAHSSITQSPNPPIHPSPPLPSEASSPAPLPAFILLLASLAYLYFALAFNVPDPDFSAFFIPLHLIVAVLMGVGLQAILNNIQARMTHPHFRHSAFGICHLSFALLPLTSIWNTLPRVDQSHDWIKYRLGQSILAQLPPQSATLLADSDKIAPLYYLQVAERQRPDLDIVVLPSEDDYRTLLDERLAAGQIVYLARYLPGLGSFYSLRSVGPIAQVSTIPFTSADYAASSSTPLSATLASNIQLVGYHADSLTPSAGDAFNATLYWNAPTVVDGNYLVYLRLLDSNNLVAWQSVGSVPVNGLYPTNAWRGGEIISDFYSLPLNLALAPGHYRLQVGLFPPFQPGPSGWADVTSLAVTPPSETPVPAHPLRARFGDNWLMGYDAPETVAPGSRVSVTLYWLPTQANASVIAFGETHSLAAWPSRTVIPQTYHLTAPLTGDSFPLAVAGLPARCAWLARETAICPLAVIRLAGQAIAAGAYNFNNQLLLTHYSLDSSKASPGGQVSLTLHWQGLQSIPDNYTVFVHLLGPDGLVHGQADSWPVAGTLATSQWQPGQAVEDRYTIQVSGDALQGDYQIEVGMYLLATLQRLPVLNTDGAVVDDKVLVTGLVVH